MKSRMISMFKCTRLIAFLLITLIALASTGWAATYYVDNQHSRASDANPGTESLPWKTIQKGANVAIAGDVVLVKNGLYREWVDVKNSGSAGKPITFKAYSGHRPIIDGTGVSVPSWNALFHASGKSYIVVDGFEVRNTRECLIRLSKGDHLTVRNCIAYNNANADGSGNNHSGIMVDHCNYGLVEYNEAYNTGHNALDGQSTNHVIFQYNYVHDNPNHNGINLFPNTSENQVEFRGNHVRNNIITGATHAIYIRYQADNEITNNLIYENIAGGIFFVDALNTAHKYRSNTKIYNNTIVDNGNNAIHNANATHMTIKNNIIAYSPSYDIYMASGATEGHVIDNNLYYSSAQFGWNGSTYNFSSWKTASGQDGKSLEADPKFANRTEDNYKLTSGSTNAVDRGLSLASAGITRDIEDVIRPQGQNFDIGAFEFRAVITTLAPPSNLRISAN